MSHAQIHDSRPVTPTIDPRLLDIALSLGDASELVLHALRTGDWTRVDELAEVDLSGHVDAMVVA